MNRKIISSDIVTKSFVKETIENVKLDLREEMKKNHEETMEKLDSITKRSHNEIMEKLDSIMGEFKKFDEEHTLLSYRTSEHSDQLENHERRLKKLETHPIIHP